MLQYYNNVKLVKQVTHEIGIYVNTISLIYH